ncbi:MAG: hypothetical protein F6K39_21510 [Okeania sp. SIO3B3]|nr:hypothetical protein [Okeania sp. SIO3B3]
MNKNSVFVLDTNRKLSNPVHPARARKLLKQGKAAVFRRYPFTIILKEESANEVKELRLKLDPGSRFTGLALLSDTNIVWCAQLEHRGFQISEALTKRRTLRSSRRNRKTRYRQPRFLNRKHPKGWLPPSLMSRVFNIESWVKKQGYQPLLIKAMGHGSRQMVNSDKYGFLRGQPKLRQKSFYSFMTGDIVKADIPKGKYAGTHTGRIATRRTGSFKLKTSTQTFDVNHKYCRHIHKSDGFSYSFGELVKYKVKTDN